MSRSAMRPSRSASAPRCFLTVRRARSDGRIPSISSRRSTTLPYVFPGSAVCGRPQRPLHQYETVAAASGGRAKRSTLQKEH
eukprot:2322199-Pyramimonas_sp.AAC.1